MKICLFTTDWPPIIGGISTHSRNLSVALSRSHGVEHVYVVALKNKLSGIEVLSEKLSVFRNADRSLLGLFLNTLRYAIKYHHCDIFHATSIFPIGFFTVLIGKFVLKKPVVVTFYGTDVLTNEGSRYTKWAKKFTLRHASSAAAFSYSTRDLAASKYDLARDFSSVIYTMVEDVHEAEDSSEEERVRTLYNIRKDDFNILFLGNLVKRKGAELLVHALALLRDPQIKLFIVGGGPEKQHLENLVSELALGKHVFLTGRVSDVEPFYAIANVFSMPSFLEKKSQDIEGLGIVYLEAELRRVPVIGTRSGGIPEAIDEGNSGLIVEEHDVNGLAHAIETLKKDPLLCRKMGEEGRRFVLENFSFSISAENHIRLYRELLGR